MPIAPTRRVPLATVDLGNTVARLSEVEGHLWLSIYGLPTDTAKPAHLFDMSMTDALPAQLRMLADVVEEFKA